MYQDNDLIRLDELSKTELLRLRDMAHKMRDDERYDLCNKYANDKSISYIYYILRVHDRNFRTNHADAVITFMQGL